MAEFLLNSIKIETNRLILREMNDSDFTALRSVLADSDIMQHYPYTFDDNRVRGWIAKNKERYRVFGFGLWGVTLKTNGEFIGDCGLTMQNINGCILPEIGYHINKRFQRLGYAHEAALSVVEWAFTATPFMVLYSYMKEKNIPSAATARSIGMKIINTFTDNENETTCVYAVTKEEWLHK